MGLKGRLLNLTVTMPLDESGSCMRQRSGRMKQNPSGCDLCTTAAPKLRTALESAPSTYRCAVSAFQATFCYFQH